MMLTYLALYVIIWNLFLIIDYMVNILWLAWFFIIVPYIQGYDELQLSDAVADASMLQCSAQFRILFINAIIGTDNASHALASSVTVRSTFNDEEEVVVIRNGWTPKKK